MEKITIKNQQAEIEVKDICVLIGHTSSGKSTIAKLLAIFNSLEFYCIIPSDDLSQFNSLLRSYNIDFKFRDETSIEYYKEPYRWTIGKEGLQTDYPYSDILFELSKNSNSRFGNPKFSCGIFHQSLKGLTIIQKKCSRIN